MKKLLENQYSPKPLRPLIAWLGIFNISWDFSVLREILAAAAKSRRMEKTLGPTLTELHHNLTLLIP